MLATQTPLGYDVACRLPDYNNIRFDGKHRVKERIQRSSISRGAGTETEKKLKKSQAFFEMMKRNHTSWENDSQSLLVIFSENYFIKWATKIIISRTLY